ncbi:hypothetical protein ES705_17572 [subsurface metagenome]
MISAAEKFLLLDAAHRRHGEVILPCGKVLEDGYMEYPGIAITFYYNVPNSKTTKSIVRWRLNAKKFFHT